jgi:hypothetical protein
MKSMISWELIKKKGSNAFIEGALCGQNLALQFLKDGITWSIIGSPQFNAVEANKP